jgi:hypothetical protein
MAFIFLDDGGPEADEYANNYVYFDPTDPQKLEEVLRVLRNRDTSDPEVKKRLIEVCQASSQARVTRPSGQVAIDWLKNILQASSKFFQRPALSRRAVA